MEFDVVGSPQDMKVGNEVACRLDFDVVDNVQTPLTHDKENNVEGFEYNRSASVIGMRFEIDDEGYYFYDFNILKLGFSVLKEYFHKFKDSTIKRRKFCCSRECHRKKDKQDINEKQHCDDTRTGYDAHMIIKLQSDGLYTIVEFEANHDHHCTSNKST